MLFSPVLLLLAICAVSRASSSFNVKSNTVTLPDGTQLRGKREGDVVAFRGVRYAEPPIGSLRWAPPQPWKNPDISQVYEATHWGSKCMQKQGGGSEDCLFLNIFVNVKDLEENAPVGIFVHGGDYVGGSSILYDCVDMVDYWDGKGIMVSTNYRLNVFGFLGSEELRAQDPVRGSTGNYGLLDQRLAFDWVRENIASFGGNPQQVTIFGESAGAGSMANHLTMKNSWGSFDKVMLESGSYGIWITQNMSVTQEAYNTLLGVTQCEDLSCLLAMPAEDLFEAHKEVPTPDFTLYGSPWNPVADGVEITTHPWIALANGHVADVPIVHGTNRDEGSWFTLLPKNATESDLNKYWTFYNYSPSQIEELKVLYLGQTYPEVEGVSQFYWAGMREFTDYEFACATKYASQHLSALEKAGHRTHSTYQYQFKHVIDDINYVYHSSEIDFVFHHVENFEGADDKAMCDPMSSYWGTFIVDKESNPSSGLVGITHPVSWPNYDASTDVTLVLTSATDIQVEAGIKFKECEFHIPRIDIILRDIFPGK